ncbi:hypothetical protein HF295_02615 [Hujiaoplasma nucleasis]|uniref:Uncharacterized protein n=1 Tax=Hujiaoplasma nucleasis TaxID=2725268 RepID=A0A7L6N0N0_9MOLU|nr:hypothetical protein [Hujiaoplasma nucleasis]QLY39810.1 hypothetical protein HF295_02615 [Hujiaoplasma nucleasis]
MKKYSWLYDLLLIILYIGVSCLVVINFCSNSYKISSEDVILVLILVTLTLSNKFNNFSIGKLFTISNTLEDKMNENKELRAENINLRNNLHNQNLQMMNVSFPSVAKNPVESATEEEIKEKDEFFEQLEEDIADNEFEEDK